MPSLTDIPPELLDRPSRLLFMKWLAEQPILNDRTLNQYISLFTKATGMHFSGLDYRFINNLLHLKNVADQQQ